MCFLIVFVFIFRILMSRARPIADEDLENDVRQVLAEGGLLDESASDSERNELIESKFVFTLCVVQFI